MRKRRDGPGRCFELQLLIQPIQLILFQHVFLEFEQQRGIVIELFGQFVFVEQLVLEQRQLQLLQWIELLALRAALTAFAQELHFGLRKLRARFVSSAAAEGYGRAA